MTVFFHLQMEDNRRLGPGASITDRGFLRALDRDILRTFTPIALIFLGILQAIAIAQVTAARSDADEYARNVTTSIVNAG